MTTLEPILEHHAALPGLFDALSARIAQHFGYPMGFGLILYPLTGLFGATRAMRDLCAKLMDDGTSAGAEDQLMEFDSFNQRIRVEERLELVR